MTIDPPLPPLWQATFSGGGDGLGVAGLSVGLGVGLACATAGEVLGDGECLAKTLEGLGEHAVVHASTAARPASHLIL